MKEIKLSQGQVALVDDHDFEWLNQWRWYAYRGVYSYYAIRDVYINKKYVHIRMHRLILGASGKILIDHKDRNGLNNQRDNLRLCNNSQNCVNKCKKKGSNTYKGVSTYHKKWRAYISFNKKWHHLGYFTSEIEAAKAYNEAAKIYHKEFANLNAF